MKPSNEAQVIRKDTCWYYEDRRGIDVRKWENGHITTARIPWGRLMKSARRCGVTMKPKPKRRGRG